MTNIILCGGAGTRLWPISRSLMPKQFNQLFKGKSLFQSTIERNLDICEKQLIISNTDQFFLAFDQVEELKEHFNQIENDRIQYLLEPIGRNTAPAIALACMALNEDEIVFVTPSDQLIKNEVTYRKSVHKAIELANDNHLVTFGIKPTFAETGFGYIESDGVNIKAFHEKPNFETATSYLNLENFYWNSGMLCFKVSVFLDELQKYVPEIFIACQNAYKCADKKEGIIRIQYKDMMTIPEDSIDYAVMEKSDNVKVIPSDIGWSDVGSFDALYNELEQDANNNTKNENLIAINSKQNLILSEKRLIATIDIDNLIIVDTADALLISKKGSSQKVKQVVEKLKEQNSNLSNTHLTVHRPWGTYTVLEDTPGYKIKRIIVRPGKRISLQKHYHRNEHWIVVSGTATVTVEKETKIIRPNESTYIKMGVVHRLSNNGCIPVVLIEVQVGEYTEEDDIVRIEDDFNR